MKNFICKMKAVFPMLYRGTVGILFFMIMTALTFVASFSTCYIAGREKIFYLPDSIAMNLLAFLLPLILWLLIYRRSGRLSNLVSRINSEERLYGRLRFWMLIGHFFVLSTWVLCTQFPAGGDQITVLDAAYGLARRDFSPLSPVNYLYDYNHQVGLAMVELLLNRLVGDYNYAVYHLINAALVTLICKNLADLGGLFGMNRVQQLATLALSILFAPLSLYASYVYGILPGLLLALVSLKLALRFFRGGKWHHALLSALTMAAAVMMKQNYAIFMIGLVLYTLVEILRSGTGKKSLLLVFLCVFYLIQAKVPLYCFSQMRGDPIPSGVSKWAWVTMGLQEGENPGWYNGYTLRTLIDSDFDTQRQEEWVKSDLRERVNELLRDPIMARDFFVKKIVSQWNEPSFESVFVLLDKQACTDYDCIGRLVSPEGNHRLTDFMNRLNFWLVGCSAGFVLLCRKERWYHEALLLPMILIGGFLFHILWEAKSQYILPYFVLLIPSAVMGFSAATEAINRCTWRSFSAGLRCVPQKTLLLYGAALLCIFGMLVILFGGMLSSLTGDTWAYFDAIRAH